MVVILKEHPNEKQLENLKNWLGSLGLDSLVFALAPALLSVAVVWPLSRRFLEKREEE